MSLKMDGVIGCPFRNSGKRRGSVIVNDDSVLHKGKDEKPIVEILGDEI